MRVAPFILVLCLLAGCLPVPHTSQRSPEFRGTVVDARTKKPVQGAKIVLSEDPRISCTSDATGAFRLKATRNHHWGYNILPTHESWQDLPAGRHYYEDAVTISHPSYVTYKKDKADDYIIIEGGIILLEGTILLEPKPPNTALEPTPTAP